MHDSMLSCNAARLPTQKFYKPACCLGGMWLPTQPMQPAAIDQPLDLCTKYPLQLGELRQCGVRSLPDTSMHNQCWESNLKPSNIESNILSTWPHVPINQHSVTQSYIWLPTQQKHLTSQHALLQCCIINTRKSYKTACSLATLYD